MVQQIELPQAFFDEISPEPRWSFTQAVLAALITSLLFWFGLGVLVLALF